MRKNLRHIDDQRMRFRAVVERYGTKANWHGFPEPTILLKEITRMDTGEIVSDHLWFTVGTSWIGFREGDIVEFDARVSTYEKGYVNHRQGIDDRQLDYKLNRPTKIELGFREAAKE